MGRNPNWSFDFPAAGATWHVRPALSHEIDGRHMAQINWETLELVYDPKPFKAIGLAILLSVAIDQIWQAHVKRATGGAGLTSLYKLTTAHLTSTPRMDSNDESAEPTGRVRPDPPTPERRRRW